jgi:hypothetical protein
MSQPILYTKRQNANGTHQTKQSLSKSQIKWIFGLSLFTAVLGSILLIPTRNEPSLGLSLWSIILLGSGLVMAYKATGKIKLNTWTILLLVSYIALSLGFILNTKDHILNVLLLIALYTVLLANLVSNVLYTNFLTRYFLAGLYAFAAKISGLFLFIGEWNSLQSETSKDSVFARYLKIGLKIFLLFLVTGFPVILLAVGLLKSTNTSFAGWVETLFSFSFGIENTFPRLVFILFVTPYLITEIYFLKELRKYAPEIRSKKIEYSVQNQKYLMVVALITIFLLNVFYLLFVVAELRYDFSNVRDLISQKGFNSYSQLAVSRFWELVIVGILNLSIIYTIAKPFKKIVSVSKSASRVFLVNSGFLLVNTLFLMYSAHKRLTLYEEGYGFTNKRLLAHLFVFVLAGISFLIFATLRAKKQSALFRYSFGIVILFFSIYIMLPTDYITNKLNYNRLKKGELVVYDPLYNVRSDFYRNDVVETNSIESDDGLFVGIDLLMDADSKLSSSEKASLKAHISQFKYENRDLPWREVNIPKLLLLRKINDAGL